MKASDNPFRISRLESELTFRPEWSGLSWERLEESWYRQGRRGAIVGKHGSGKTALLEAWEQRLREQGEQVIRIFLNRQRRRLPRELQTAIASATVVLVDGAEQLNFLRYRRLLAMAQGKGWLETRHRQASFPTVANLQASRTVLNKCLAALGEEVAPDLLDGWWEASDHNLRETLLHCYDWKAAEPAPDSERVPPELRLPPCSRTKGTSERPQDFDPRTLERRGDGPCFDNSQRGQ